MTCSQGLSFFNARRGAAFDGVAPTDFFRRRAARHGTARMVGRKVFYCEDNKEHILYARAFLYN